eukprot:CAMPEP_0171098232 /NCGR_PEP_ID=MMETSP0766_2-20121228/48009_1 /TAXON_ID=439317 /ORGANISM="Gambierdiscus australes, Strain CAWD 149" /LENGTH=206 /DNA_ID=CAMNT_0011557553 /DNA_START=22 /DNA_END=643 /DNA_ORIENTATION=+
MAAMSPLLPSEAEGQRHNQRCRCNLRTQGAGLVRLGRRLLLVLRAVLLAPVGGGSVHVGVRHLLAMVALLRQLHWGARGGTTAKQGHEGLQGEGLHLALLGFVLVAARSKSAMVCSSVCTAVVGSAASGAACAASGAACAVSGAPASVACCGTRPTAARWPSVRRASVDSRLEARARTATATALNLKAAIGTGGVLEMRGWRSGCV